MSLTVEQQILNLLRNRSRVLVCLPSNPTTDAVASGLAMYSLLQKMQKHVRITAAGFTLPHNHRFLSQHITSQHIDSSDVIEHHLAANKKIVINVDISRTGVQELTYDIKDSTLNIFITPQQHQLHSSDVNTVSSQYEFDLIIVLDSRDLNSLGHIFEHNAEFFHDTPIVNLDHHPGNEHFGQINYVQVTATSISEIIFELISHLEQIQPEPGTPLLDEHVATSLLTGIISKTKSFQTNSVTPRSLAIASYLISSGARREEIVHHLYQTKSIQSLQLWGRTLSALQSDSAHKIVWSMLKREDFAATNSSPLDLETVIDELIVNTPDAKNIYVVYEQPDAEGQVQINALVYTAPYIQGIDLFKDWASHGSSNFTYISVPHSSLQMAQQMIHDRILSLVK